MFRASGSLIFKTMYDMSHVGGGVGTRTRSGKPLEAGAGVSMNPKTFRSQSGSRILKGRCLGELREP